MRAQGFTKETILKIGLYDRKFPDFSAGDTIEVVTLVKESVSAVGKDKQNKNQKRNQSFVGTVLAIKNSGISKTFSVRSICEGVSIEKTFPYYSLSIVDVKIISRGSVRRAKLYYLRTRYGKSSEVKKKKNIGVATIKGFSKKPANCKALAKDQDAVSSSVI